MDAKDYLSGFSKKLEPFAARFFDQKIKEALKIDPFAADSLQKLQNYMYGGKKVRAALAALGYQIAGGKDFEKILPACLAVELVHNALIIHDDFIDNDIERRGKPTLHTIYSKGRNAHYGASQAIVVGDIAIFMGQELLSKTGLQSDLVARAVCAFNRLLLNTGYGEFLDVAFDYKENITWDDVLKVRKYKTAHYTFVMPLTVGAILGGADKAKLGLIEKYAEPVGIGFQIHDDILGVFGDSEITGKSNNSDIREGKKTLLFFKSLELVKGKDLQFFKKWYGRKDLDNKKIEKLRHLIDSSGSLEYSHRVAREYVRKGKTHINKLTPDRDLRETLYTFADYMITRTK